MATLAVYVLLLVPLLPIIVPFLCLSRAAFRRQGVNDGLALRLPPSPWALPVIGHLHHFVGALPHRAMRDLARRHGPLILLRLGRLPVIVASSADAAREVMKTRDLDFATRSMSRALRLAFPEGTEGIIFTPYGDAWRQVRRICTIELLSARRVQSFRPVREEEAGCLLRAVASAASKAEAVNLSEMIAAYAADSAVRAIIGNRLKDRDAFLALLERSVKLFARMSLPDLYPSSRLAMLVSRMPGRMNRQRRELVGFMDAIVRDHEENKATDDDANNEDLLDVLMRVQREGALHSLLTTDNIKSVIVDLLGTGSETAATTLRWIMAELVRNPREMRKAQDEVRHVLAGQHGVTEDDSGKLRYVHLVIKEALRLHPPAPLLFPRECRSACRVLGFDVPKGTMVLVNAWAISRDPEYWDMPDDFVPERFQHSKIDFKGTDFEYTLFGAGRRVCPGMAFALVNVEDDLGKLRYVHLVIKEALRLHPPAPLLFPRECRSACRVLGFDVPKGTMVPVNAWAISRDPEYWDMPDDFVPERSQHSKIDFKGTDFEYTLFGAGRRMCPGMAFALVNVDLVLASLLFHFDWELPRGMEPVDLDMTEEIGVTVRRLQDLVLLPIVRVPLPVE